MLKNCQKGSSMIEMMGVLGIISMVTVGIMATVSKIYDRYQQTSVITQIRDLQKNIQTRYATASDYRDLSKNETIKTLIEERVIPYDMVNGTKIFNAYGGDVTLAGTQYDYTVTFSDIKKNACVDLLVMNWAVNNTSDLIKLKVAGKTFTWTGQNSASKLPISTVDAASLCQEEQSKNKIEWTFQ